MLTMLYWMLNLVEMNLENSTILVTRHKRRLQGDERRSVELLANLSQLRSNQTQDLRKMIFASHLGVDE